METILIFVVVAPILITLGVIVFGPLLLGLAFFIETIADFFKPK